MATHSTGAYSGSVDIAGNIQRVREAIDAACARVHRDAAGVRLMTVTKTVEPQRILEAARHGIDLFGENRVQERASKRAQLAGLNAEWHLIGNLQSNKAARAVELFDCIQTIDSIEIARRLDRVAARRPRPLPVLIEINIADEPQKHGVRKQAAPELAAGIRELPHLELRGVMTVPPYSDDPEASRPFLIALRELGQRIRDYSGHHAASEPAWELSMGMSHDFTVAVEEGATIVRVGSAIFGPRPTR